jgi:hypothetical protein
MTDTTRVVCSVTLWHRLVNGNCRMTHCLDQLQNHKGLSCNPLLPSVERYAKEGVFRATSWA